MTDLVDDNKKTIASFGIHQEIQEVNEGKVKFHFATSTKQRKLNFGKKPDPEQIQERSQGRFQKSLVLNMSRQQLYNITFPSAVQINVYPIYDDFNKLITPNDPRYVTWKPISITIQVSNRHPFPLSRFDKLDLDSFITETFGKYIIEEFSESKAKHDEHFKGIEDLFISHAGFLQTNEVTGKDDLNKRAFNVFGAKVFDHELNYLNNKLEILGHKKVKPIEALLKTEKTINKPSYYIFEFGET